MSKPGKLRSPTRRARAARGTEGPELSEHVAQSIEKIATLHTEAERRVGRHQKTIERLTAAIGRPWSLNLIVAGVTLWLAFNCAAPRLGLHPVDPPPFAWLQGALCLCALLVTTMVLTTQNRQAKRASQHGELDLQVNLVAEQKIAKLISLLEELRRDLPSVRDRVDPVAEAMTEAVDPHAVLTVLEETLKSSLGDPAASFPDESRPSEAPTSSK